MYRLSSNWTLFYRLFLPTFWIGLAGAVVVTIWFLNVKSFGSASVFYVRSLVTSFYVTTIIILYFTFLQLKRVEISEDYLYVTNYFRHRRYPLGMVEKISERNFGLMRVGKIYLKESGSFGKELLFMVSGSEYHLFWEKYPVLDKRLRNKS